VGGFLGELDTTTMRGGEMKREKRETRSQTPEVWAFRLSEIFGHGAPNEGKERVRTKEGKKSPWGAGVPKRPGVLRT